MNKIAASNGPRNALVVGGTRRVGRWVTEHLLEQGWRVRAIFRHDVAAAAELSLAWQRSGRLSTVQADALDADGFHSVVERCVGENMPLHLLVCAAGSSNLRKLSETEASDLEGLWRSNVLSVHNAVSASLPALRRAPHGDAAILMFSVLGASSKAYRDIPAYASCKAMLESYARSLALELAPEGIRVYCVALGVADLPQEGAPEYGAASMPGGRIFGKGDISALLKKLLHRDGTASAEAIVELPK